MCVECARRTTRSQLEVAEARRRRRLRQRWTVLYGYWDDFFRFSLSFCFIVDMAFTEPNNILAVTWTRRGGVAGLSPAAPPLPPADDGPYPPHAPFRHLVGPLLFTSPPADRVGEPSGTLVLDEPFDIWKVTNTDYSNDCSVTCRSIPIFMDVLMGRLSQKGGVGFPSNISWWAEKKSSIKFYDFETKMKMKKIISMKNSRKLKRRTLQKKEAKLNTGFETSKKITRSSTWLIQSVVRFE